MSATVHKIRPDSFTDAWGLDTRLDAGGFAEQLPDELDPSVERQLKEEVLSALRAHSYKVSVRTNTFYIDPAALDVLSASLPARAMLEEHTVLVRRPGDVPLHALLRFGSALAMTTCAVSLAMWLLDAAAILNPYAAILGLMAGPFVYWMGEVAKR